MCSVAHSRPVKQTKKLIDGKFTSLEQQSADSERNMYLIVCAIGNRRHQRPNRFRHHDDCFTAYALVLQGKRIGSIPVEIVVVFSLPAAAQIFVRS